jgi:hypothetical protein
VEALPVKLLTMVVEILTKQIEKEKNEYLPETG